MCFEGKPLISDISSTPYCGHPQWCFENISTHSKSRILSLNKNTSKYHYYFEAFGNLRLVLEVGPQNVDYPNKK